MAIIFVLFRHTFQSRLGGAGMVGVDLFFVLSGFLITSLLLDEQHKTGRVSLRLFYIRRALRLLPALYAVVAVNLVAAAFGHSKGLLVSALAAATYTTPFTTMLHAPAAGSLGVTWTLAIEEYFYLLWPLALIVALRRRGTVLGFAAGSVVALMVVRWVVWLAVGAPAYYSPSTWAESLMIGCAAAALWRWRPVRAPWPLAVIAGLFLCAVAFLPDLKLHALAYSPFLTLVGLAGAVLVVAATDPRGPVRLLAHPVMRYIGRRSYALYLWNPVFLLWMTHNHLAMLIGVPASFACAELSYRLVEAPALRLKARFTATAATVPVPRREVLSEGVAPVA